MALKEFSPLDEFQQAFKRLWLIIVMTLGGGIFGWIYHYIQPPIYEAKSVVVVDIDFAQTGKLEQIEQDQVIGAAFILLGSTPVLKQAMVDIQEQGIRFSGFVFQENMFMERRQSQLILRVRDKDPQVAAKVANIWVTNAYETLVRVHDHALRAQVLRNYLSALKDCPTSPAIEPAPPGICGLASPEETYNNLLAVEAALEKETEAGNGIIPALSIGLSRMATVPDVAVVYNRGLMILAGAAIGLVLSLMLATLRNRSV